MRSTHMSDFFILAIQRSIPTGIFNCYPRSYTSAYTSQMDFCFLCTYPFKYSSAVCITDKPFRKGWGSWGHSRIYSNASDLTVFNKFREHVILNCEQTISFSHTCTISRFYKWDLNRISSPPPSIKSQSNKIFWNVMNTFRRDVTAVVFVHSIRRWHLIIN